MAYNFTGSEYTKTNSNPITGYPFSMSGWFFTNSTAYQTIVHLGSSGANEQSLYIYNQKAVASSYINATGGLALTTASISLGQWQHVAGVWASSSQRSIYLNGGNKVTSTTSIAYSANLTGVYIGAAFYNNSLSGFMRGQIAEPAIWNAALTDAEIASLAAGFTPDQVSPQSLQFYAPLVRDLVDVRGGRTITNVNSATVATHPRIIT